jgi:predicted nucleotidyltransferase
MAFIKKHWIAAIGCIWLLNPIWSGFRWLLALLGDLDLVISRYEDPDWMGPVMKGVWEILLNPPGWSIIPAMIIGLGLIWIDASRAARHRAKDAPESRKQLEYIDLKKAARNWLRTKLSDSKLAVQQAWLFGSITHDHYDTSDVDIIILFKPMGERQIAAAVRKITDQLASQFRLKFNRDLHVKFFCAHEENNRMNFLARTKHEALI